MFQDFTVCFCNPASVVLQVTCAFSHKPNYDPRKLGLCLKVVLSQKQCSANAQQVHAIPRGSKRLQPSSDEEPGAPLAAVSCRRVKKTIYLEAQVQVGYRGSIQTPCIVTSKCISRRVVFYGFLLYEGHRQMHKRCAFVVMPCGLQQAVTAV